MEWKEFKGYKFSSEGDVIKPNGKQIKFRGEKNYRVCGLGLVHQIIAFLFLSHPDAEKHGRYSFEGYAVHHKDMDRTNNSISNLIYLTHEEHVAEHVRLRNNKL